MDMSALMVVLKVDCDCQYTLSRVIDEAQRALSAQHKSRKRARKLAKELAMARWEYEDNMGLSNCRLQQWGQAAPERDELHDRLMNLTIERDELH
jgi:hypothetical protein